MANWVYTNVVATGPEEELEKLIIRLENLKLIDYEKGDDDWTGRLLFLITEEENIRFSEFLDSEIDKNEIENGFIKYSVKSKWVFKEELFIALREKCNLEFFVFGEEETGDYVFTNDINKKFFEYKEFKFEAAINNGFELHKKLKKLKNESEELEKIQDLEDEIYDERETLHYTKQELIEILNREFGLNLSNTISNKGLMNEVNSLDLTMQLTEVSHVDI